MTWLGDVISGTRSLLRRAKAVTERFVWDRPSRLSRIGRRTRPWLVAGDVQGPGDRFEGLMRKNEMSSFAYPATFRRDEARRVVVSFPDFPKSHTDGKDLREALEEAIDCLGSTIAAKITDK